MSAGDLPPYDPARQAESAAAILSGVGQTRRHLYLAIEAALDLAERSMNHCFGCGTVEPYRVQSLTRQTDAAFLVEGNTAGRTATITTVNGGTHYVCDSCVERLRFKKPEASA